MNSFMWLNATSVLLSVGVLAGFVSLYLSAELFERIVKDIIRMFKG